MKLTSICIGLFGFSLVAALAAADENPPPKKPQPSVTVFPNKCQFAVPIDNPKRIWQWGVSEKDTCEYSWMTTIKVDDNAYELGYSFFNPDAVKRSGTFDQLLDAGQTNMWLLDSDEQSASYVRGVRVKARLNGNRLLFEIEDKEWTDRLFKNRPMVVTFRTSGTQLKSSKTDGKVEYKSAPKQNDRQQCDAPERATFSVFQRRSRRLSFVVFPRSLALVHPSGDLGR